MIQYADLRTSRGNDDEAQRLGEFPFLSSVLRTMRLSCIGHAVLIYLYYITISCHLALGRPSLRRIDSTFTPGTLASIPEEKALGEPLENLDLLALDDDSRLNSPSLDYRAPSPSPERTDLRVPVPEPGYSDTGMILFLGDTFFVLC